MKKAQLVLFISVAVLGTQGVQASQTSTLSSSGLANLAATNAVSRSMAVSAALAEIQQNSEFNYWNADSRHQMGLERVETSDDVTTVQLKHEFQGIEVFGSKILRHQGQTGVDLDSALARFDLDVTPTLSESDAVGIAKSSLDDRAIAKAPKLIILPSQTKDSAQLVYVVELENVAMDGGYEVWVDAHSGSILGSHQNFESLAPFEAYYATSACQSVNPQNGMPNNIDPTKCQIVLRNGQSVGQSADLAAQQASNNAKAVLSYYSIVHHRDSFDNHGATSRSIVHIGQHWDNAGWFTSLQIMGYGDGDGTTFKSFTSALDVAGHEMTHAVVSATAQFAPFDEQGAANEAYADFFGIAVAGKDNWNIGRELFINPNDGPIRCLADPHSCGYSRRDAAGQVKKYPYPATMSEKLPKQASCDATNDRCWVHLNAPILGHAMYEVRQAIGRQAAEKLMYLTLTQYLTANVGFKDIRNQTMKACPQLLDSASCVRVAQAYAIAGL